MTPAPIVVTAGFVGAVVASFATTVAMRASVAAAPEGRRSACDDCRRSLNWLETLPIVSFLALRGRCRTCAGPISVLHPLGELIGLIAMTAIVLVAPNLRGLAMAIMAMALLATSVGDVLTSRLNTALTVVVLACSIFLAADLGLFDVLTGLASAAFWLVVMTGVSFLYRLKRKRTGLGRGDIWLAAALAVWLGVASCWMVVIAAALTLVFAMLSGRLKQMTPQGPAIAASGFTIGLLLEVGLWPRL